MRAELPDTHTGAGKSSTISQITGLTRQHTYHELKKAWQDKIREAYSRLSIPDPPNNSQPNTESLKKSMDQLVETIHQTQHTLTIEYRKMLTTEKQKHAYELDAEKQKYEANMTERDRKFGEATRILRTDHERELKKLQDQLEEYEQSSELPPLLHEESPDHITIYDENRGLYVKFSVTKDKTTHALQVHVTWTGNNNETEISSVSKLTAYETPTENVANYTFLQSNGNIAYTFQVHGEARAFNIWLLYHKNVIELCEDFKTHASITNLGKQYHTENNPPPRPTRRKYTVRVPGL